MAEGGIPMEQIREYFGHTSVKVTERVYARFSPEFLRNGAKAMVPGSAKNTVDIGSVEPVDRIGKRTK
jgi:integrase